MGRHLAAVHMSLVDDGFHLLQRVLGLAHFRTLGKDAAGGAELDQVDAVLDVSAHRRANGPRPVGHAVCALFEGVVQ